MSGTKGKSPNKSALQALSIEDHVISIDIELDVINRCVTALLELDEPERVRVMHYLDERFT